jgi:arylsulfatase
MKDGVPAFHYNFLDRERFTVEGGQALPPGAATIRFEFDYDGGGPGRGGTGKIFVDGKQTGEGRIGRTQPLLFSADETADVGIDLQTPVVEVLGAGEGNRFNGRIPRVTVALTPSP